jgi:hypothetical protein
MLSFKHILLAGLSALVFSSQSVIAQSYSPYSYYNNWSNNYSGNNYRNPYGAYGSNYNNYGRPAQGYSNYGYRPQGYTGYNNTYRAPQNSRAPAAQNQGRPVQSYTTPSPQYQYRAPAPAQNPAATANAYRAPNAMAPNSYRPNPGNYRQPYAYSYPYRPWYPKKKNNSMFDDGPFNGGDFAEELWPGRDSVWEDALPIDGPWNRDWGKAPWNRDYADMYGKEGGPTKWFDIDDPKEGAAVMWEDALFTPHALGTMPGGWDAPTVVVPNPIDVGDEFKDASTDFPGEIRDFADGFTYGDRTVTGNKAGSNPNAGGFGVGGGQKKDGINIESKPRR